MNKYVKLALILGAFVVCAVALVRSGGAATGALLGGLCFLAWGAGVVQEIVGEWK